MFTGSAAENMYVVLARREGNCLVWQGMYSFRNPTPLYVHPVSYFEVPLAMLFQRLSLLPCTIILRIICSHLNVLCIHTHTCSPGMNAEDDVDDKVIECCSDADVFVYVANGVATFETTVSSSVDTVQYDHVWHAINTYYS